MQLLSIEYCCGSEVRRTPAGGKAEADAAYEEAMEAVFRLQADQYSHVQYYEAPRTVGQPRRRWYLIELWPLQVRWHQSI